MWRVAGPGVGVGSITSKGCKCLLLSGVSVVFYTVDTLPRADGARHRARLDGLKTALQSALRGRWVFRGDRARSRTREAEPSSTLGSGRVGFFRTVP